MENALDNCLKKVCLEGHFKFLMEKLGPLAHLGTDTILALELSLIVCVQ